MIVEKEMFLDVDGKQVGMEMTECQLAVSSQFLMLTQHHCLLILFKRWKMLATKVQLMPTKLMEEIDQQCVSNKLAD